MPIEEAGGALLVSLLIQTVASPGAPVACQVNPAGINVPARVVVSKNTDEILSVMATSYAVANPWFVTVRVIVTTPFVGPCMVLSKRKSGSTIRVRTIPETTVFDPGSENVANAIFE